MRNSVSVNLYLGTSRWSQRFQTFPSNYLRQKRKQTKIIQNTKTNKNGREMANRMLQPLENQSKQCKIYLNTHL